MIDFKVSSDCKTVITWQGEHCEAVVDIGTVDATSAVQLGILLRKMEEYSYIHMEYNEYGCAIVKWHVELYNTRWNGVYRDRLVREALDRVAGLVRDIAAYNHHCAIMETAEEAKVA